MRVAIGTDAGDGIGGGKNALRALGRVHYGMEGGERGSVVLRRLLYVMRTCGRVGS